MNFPATSFFRFLLVPALWLGGLVPSGAQQGGVVINEIHYDEDDPTVHAEFIELHNNSTAPVSLSGWYLSDAVPFVFPAEAVLAAGGYLIVCENPAVAQAKWGVSGASVFNWNTGVTLPEIGRLKNGGDRIMLRNAAGEKMSEVEYQAGFPWPTTGGVPSTSIELIHPALDHTLGGNWRRSGGDTAAKPTPLARNSVFSENAPPAIRQVNHTPVSAEAPGEWPRSGQEMKITAKITDPQGVGAVTLAYQTVEPGDYITLADARYENAASWISLPMRDDGTAGDAVAGDEIFSALIPPGVQTHRRLIRYRITAGDTAGLTGRVPYADDPQPNFAYYVYNAVPDYVAKATPAAAEVRYSGAALAPLPVYHLVTTLQHHANAQQVPVIKPGGTVQTPSGGQYQHGLYNWHGALCYNGKVYDHIRYRARGGVWRFAMGKNMWKFDFNKGHDLQVLDNYGKPFGQAWKKLNFSAVIQQADTNLRGEQGLFESVGFRLFQLTGLPAENTAHAHFRIVERPDETNASPSQFDDDFQGLYLAIEQQDGQFLDEHGLPDGNLYKMEAGTGELNNQGPLQPKNKSDLTAFLKYSSTEAWWRTNVDLPNYYNYRAIVDAIHHYDIGDGKNYFYYHNPDTNRWTALPWDLDLTWADNVYRADSGIAGLTPSGNTTEPFFSRIFGNGRTTGIAPLRMELRNRVREILDLLYTQEQTGMLIDEMAAWIHQPGQPGMADADRAMWDYHPIMKSSYVNSGKSGQGRYYQSGVNNPATPENEAKTFAGMIQRMKNYVTTRRNVMTAQLLTSAEEAVIPATPVASRPGDGPMAVNALTFTGSDFSGKNGTAFAALKWRIAEVTDPALPGFLPFGRTEPRAYEAVASWESEEITTFSPDITIPALAAKPGGMYRVRVKHKDTTGRWSHWSAPVQFTAGAADISGYMTSLVISQFMFDPAPPSAAEAAVSPEAGAYEWVELMNTGAVAVDLSPVRFTKGIDFDFAGSAVTALAPGARVIVASNPAAFQARYGTAFPGVVVAGAWEAGDALNNTGEQIKLSFGAGTAIRDFAYSAAAPWPAGSRGYALMLKQPAARPDHVLAENWRLSAVLNGTPGQGETPPQVTGYAVWAKPFGDPAPDADTDGDGFTNAAEYLLATSPVSSSSVPLMQVSWTESDGGKYLTITSKQRMEASDVTGTPEISTDLKTWKSGAESVMPVSSVPDGDGILTMVTWRSMTPAGGAESRQFFRLRIGYKP